MVFEYVGNLFADALYKHSCHISFFHIQRTKYTIIKGIYIAPIYIKIHPIKVSNNIITAEVFEE